ncbi:hypothetical protein LR948_00810 [Roseivivax sp. GX 12232]|uniref:hypothetical protein n=1 Tax=Roseivivax sp. GX 12232 TaxID=2900547 RepID=UPI001E3FA465|nr:hypothetical protein [Roseivivax sp. GX 12232]MCE0503884.1 hypothetical protein [Roseivivax sp. GX 12232]
MSDSTLAPLTALEKLLKREAGALARGEGAAVGAELEEKSRLLTELEAGQGALAERAERDEKLRARLAALKEMLSANGARIAHLRDTMGGLARDLASLQERQGLGGLYGADGSTREAGVANPQRLNREA